MKPAIEIKNLGKQYMLQEAPPYIALRDVISQPLKKLFNPAASKVNTFWALQDINLSIEPGERVGIIGRNGAGKSTLLKIISRITPPSTGEAFIRGRVGSLLEVGTGFHPELTGRENIYLNGSILGLKKAEINRQLEAIIDFSGVEKFIDSPLKHYSSGMQLRLAFSVAAHLEPEILLIDEVLAVGDLEFQKKCLGKMEEVSKKDGRTILFVSHNMSYITSLCSKAMLLDKGKLTETGTPVDIINSYISSLSENKSQNNKENNNHSSPVKFISIKAFNTEGVQSDSFSSDKSFKIEMQYSVLEEGHIIWLGYNIFNNQGVNIFDTHSIQTAEYNTPHAVGEYVACATIPGNLFNTGVYFIGCAAFNHLKQTIHFHQKDALAINIYDRFDVTNARGMSPGDFPGVIRPLLKWQIEKI